MREKQFRERETQHCTGTKTETAQWQIERERERERDHSGTKRGTIQRKRDKQFRNNETYSSWRKRETAQELVENQLKGKKREQKIFFPKGNPNSESLCTQIAFFLIYNNYIQFFAPTADNDREQWLYFLPPRQTVPVRAGVLWLD